MSLKAIREKKIALKISEFTEFEIGPNKRKPVFRVTRPYLNLLMKPRIFSRSSGKNNEKKLCVPTLPKIFRPVTRNTYFFIWPNERVIFRSISFNN